MNTSTGCDGQDRILLSVITPAFNEADNLPVLFDRLSSALSELKIEWEWVIVDDHSSDGTYAVVQDMARREPRVRGLRLSRNSGSHAALTCGLFHSRGRCAIIMAADLQDPPETISGMLAKWRQGAQVVWAVRAAREGESTTTIGFSRLYYWVMRRVVGLKEIPATGADFFLIDRLVIDAFKQFRETHVSLFALITWMGFRQEHILYVKQARLHSVSGWTLQKKLRLVVDSVTAFTFLPIHLMSYLGFLIAVAGFIYALIIIVKALAGELVQGWSSIMVAVLFLGGAQMVMMGVLGEYLWRALDESRQRPRYLVEADTLNADSGAKDSQP